MDPNLVITAVGVAVALFIGGMQVWIALQQQKTADKQATLSRIQGDLQTRQGELQTVSSWLPFLADTDENVRLAAVLALDRIEGAAAVPPLATALNDASEIVRNRAAHALARRTRSDNVDAIIEIVASFLENQDPAKAEAALDALVKIGLPSAEKLRAFLKQPLPETTRKQAEQALRQILLNEQVMKKIGVLESHKITQGRPEIVVALVGGGVDRSLPDVAAALVEEVDHVDDDSGPAQSTAFAARLIVGHPESDVVGVAPGVRLLSEKVLSGSGSGTVSNIISGIDHATQAGARIIFLEFGSSSASDEMARAIKHAHEAGALVVASAGNGGDESKIYPAAFEHVMAVAATDGNDRKAVYSSYGDWIDIAAPGNPTLGKESTAGELALKGTSFSGSLAAGAAALVWSVNPAASAQAVAKALLDSAKDLDERNPTFAGKLGHGRLNVLAAVERISAETSAARQDLSRTSPPSSNADGD